MKKLISLLLVACMCISAFVMLAACEEEEETQTTKTTVTEAEWRKAMEKEKFYNVKLEYSDCRYNKNSGETDKYGPSVIEYDGDLRRGDGSDVKENSGDMDSAEIYEMVSMGLDHYKDATYDEETKQYTVMVHNENYNMNFGLVYKFENGALIHCEWHFLFETDTLADMYKTQWFVMDFSNYGAVKLSK